MTLCTSIDCSRSLFVIRTETITILKLMTHGEIGIGKEERIGRNIFIDLSEYSAYQRKQKAKRKQKQ